ncbi:MAG: allantoicase [Candidatus Competibacter sp.]
MSLAPCSDPPAFVARWPNLAQPRLGAVVLSASDEFFASKERLLNPEPPLFVPGKFDEHGKWMDGWETRRRRGPGHDWCIIRLGLSGTVAGVDIDTSHFTGNYPPAASLDGYRGDRDPEADAVWTSLLPATPLQGNRHHYLAIDDSRIWSHLRLNIYPDGGIARLRVHGQPHCDWTRRDRSGLYDLLALEHGGRALAWNDQHFGAAANLLLPGRGLTMGDGWETRRRREPGHDWALLALGHPGVIRRIEVDTAHFKGNFPDRCALQAAFAPDVPEAALVAQSQFWPTLLPEQPLRADAIQIFESEIQQLGPISHIRFNILPDGGVSRLRLFGALA